MYCRTEMLSLLLRTWPRVACQTRAASKKPFARTAKVMKTYNQENKLMFGVLLESSLERNKRRNSKLPLSDDQTDINSPKNLSYESSSNSGPISFEQLTAAFEEELPLPKQKAAKKTAKTIKSTKVCSHTVWSLFKKYSTPRSSIFFRQKRKSLSHKNLSPSLSLQEIFCTTPWSAVRRPRL